MKATVYIDPKSIYPLPAKQRVYCALCESPTARWRRIPEYSHQCSNCVLYNTAWGKERSDEIRALISETEALVGSPFEKDERGRLAKPFDADRIVVAIVISSKLKELGEK